MAHTGSELIMIPSFMTSWLSDLMSSGGNARGYRKQVTGTVSWQGTHGPWYLPPSPLCFPAAVMSGSLLSCVHLTVGPKATRLGGFGLKPLKYTFSPSGQLSQAFLSQQQNSD